MKRMFSMINNDSIKSKKLLGSERHQYFLNFKVQLNFHLCMLLKKKTWKCLLKIDDLLEIIRAYQVNQKIIFTCFLLKSLTGIYG